MTAAVELTEVLQDTQREFYRLDDRYWSDIYERRDKVHKMTGLGLSANEIADELGTTQRNVVRMRKLEPVPDLPVPPDPQSITDERAAELEATALVAMGLACRLRDENPCITWAALLKLDHRALLELTFVLLAGMDVDRPVSELYGWVIDLAPDREDVQ